MTSNIYQNDYLKYYSDLLHLDYKMLNIYLLWEDFNNFKNLILLIFLIFNIINIINDNNI
jgi:hypothetical protein